jgi:hypothetical protein
MVCHLPLISRRLFLPTELSMCKHRLCRLVLIALLLGLACCRTIAAEPALTIHVATNGNDAWSGRIPTPANNDGPFLTLQRARDEIRKVKKAGALPNGGITVEIHAGTYELAAPLQFSAEDSGTKESPIIWRAKKGEVVKILGGRVVKNWQPVTDPKVLAVLDPAARGKVVQADLKAQGITDLGEMKAGPNWGQSTVGLELFFEETPTTLARWPNEGFVKIPKVLGKIPVDCRGTKGCQDGVFSYEGDRPRRWIGQPDIMFEGYWFWDWADQRLKVKSIDPEKRVIALEDQPVHAFGFRNGQWYYAYNLLPELDQPGEWYLDRAKGVLFFWPPKPIEKGCPTVSMLPSLVEMNNTSYVAICGLLLEMCRGTAIQANNVANVRIVGCTIRNTGSSAVWLAGRDSRVIGCDMYGLADSGIALSGGDRKTLTAGNLVAENNHIHHYGRVNRMYKAGISLNGVGNRALHNLIHSSPHQAMNFGGNDHLIEWNEIHDVCTESNDAGAIYAGRNWTMRGNVIRHNYFHDINGFEGRGCVGVYLDDQFSSADIVDNLFVRVNTAAMIGGGRDCTIANNIFVDCSPALHIDARGKSWCAEYFDRMKEGLKEVPYQDAVWAKRYPKLVNILNEEPMAALGNLVARNICVGGKWGNFLDNCEPRVKFENNLIGQDPHFVDAAKGNYQLKDDSPAWKLGFQKIPLEKIGLYESPWRASWPVSQKTSQPRMKLGAYYFAGWAGKCPYDDGKPEHAWAKGMPTHFTKKLATDYAGRTPLWGWRDDKPELMERQIDLAADHGIAYFSFCWYWQNNRGPINVPGIESDSKHLPMQLFMKAKNNKRMEFCLLVANHEGAEIVGFDAWKQAADYWLTLFKHPQYLRTEGKPVLAIFSAQGIDKKGLDYLQEAAKKAGFPGVAVVGCGSGKAEDGFQMRTHYNVTPEASWASGRSEKHTYQELVDANVKAWNVLPGQPFIPVATQGWDRRPWEAKNGEGYADGAHVSWYFEKGTPQAFGEMLDRMARWIETHPDAATKDRLALMYAWNEIGEGGWLVPCREDPNGEYLKAVRRAVFGR